MKRYVSKISKIVLFVFSFIFLVYLAEAKTDGFSLCKIKARERVNPLWSKEVKVNVDKDILSILDQKFIYLNKGRQCFVFESEDKKYIVKFFNHFRFHFPPKKFSLDSLYKEESLKRTFLGYEIAFKELKEISGLLFIHLSKTSGLKKKICVENKCGRIFFIDLDNTEFVLQKKARPIFEVLEKMSEEQIKEAFFSFLDLIVFRCGKNLCDSDSNIKINYGFVDNQIIVFDVGRLFRDRRLEDLFFFKKEIVASSKGLKKWLEDKHPDLLKDFDAYLDKLVR